MRYVCLALLLMAANVMAESTTAASGLALTTRQQNIMNALIHTDVEAWRNGEREHLTFLKNAEQFKSTNDVESAAKQLAEFTSETARSGLPQDQIEFSRIESTEGNVRWLLLSTVLISYSSQESLCHTYDDKCRAQALKDSFADDSVPYEEQRQREEAAMQALGKMGFPKDIFGHP